MFKTTISIAWRSRGAGYVMSRSGKFIRRPCFSKRVCDINKLDTEQRNRQIQLRKTLIAELTLIHAEEMYKQSDGHTTKYRCL